MEDYAVGIDLGTTFCCVAVLKNNRVEIIPNDMDENLTPSIVTFFEGSDPKVGKISELISSPKHTIYSIKRMMGKLYKDEKVEHDIKSKFWNFDIVENKETKKPQIQIENSKSQDGYDYYYPEEISAIILKHLAQMASNYLDQEIENAVITVPAYFDDEQRKATRDAAKNAGLNVLNIINEPTAASLAYGLDKKFSKDETLSFSTIFRNNYSKKIMKSKTKLSTQKI